MSVFSFQTCATYTNCSGKVTLSFYEIKIIGFNATFNTYSNSVISFFFFLIHNIFLLKSVHLLVKKTLNTGTLSRPR